jgi:hypothetical protein
MIDFEDGDGFKNPSLGAERFWNEGLLSEK